MTGAAKAAEDYKAHLIFFRLREEEGNSRLLVCPRS